MSDSSTLPIQLPAVRPPAAARVVRTAPKAVRPSLARRRWGFAVAALLIVVTLPAHLLGLALVGLEVLSPSTDGTGPLLIGGVGLAHLLLLTGVASVGQLIGGGDDVWRRRISFACLNALLVVAAAAIAWAFLI